VTESSELWRTDGTVGGTTAVFRTTTPSGTYSAGNLGDASAASGHVYFTRDDGAHGIELWATPKNPVEIVGRHVFYNRSVFDGDNPAANAGDDAAIATDKTALLDGPRTFANVTSYSRGINGIMIDVAGNAPLTALAGLAAGATFKTGPGGDDLVTWAPAPGPSQISIRPGAGVNGSDRITLVWPDGVIKNTWLQVTIPVLPQVGLPTPEVFYLGNHVGETQPGSLGAPLRVNALDLALVKARLNTAAGIENPADVNRDGRVSALDLGIVRANLNHLLPEIIAPVPGAAPATLATRVWDDESPDLLA